MERFSIVQEIDIVAEEVIGRFSHAQHDPVGEFVSEISDVVSPIALVFGVAIPTGLIVRNEYVTRMEASGKKVGSAKKHAAFVIGATGGALISTPFAMVLNEMLSAA